MFRSPQRPNPTRPPSRERHHDGSVRLVLFYVTIAWSIAAFATYREAHRAILRSDYNVDRQERIRVRQFAELRSQIGQDMADQATASDASVQRVMSDWFAAAGNRMAAVSERRERALRLIGARTGVTSAELDAIFAEPLPPYPSAPPEGCQR